MHRKVKFPLPLLLKKFWSFTAVVVPPIAQFSQLRFHFYLSCDIGSEHIFFLANIVITSKRFFPLSFTSFCDWPLFFFELLTVGFFRYYRRWARSQETTYYRRYFPLVNVLGWTGLFLHRNFLEFQRLTPNRNVPYFVCSLSRQFYHKDVLSSRPATK